VRDTCGADGSFGFFWTYPNLSGLIDAWGFDGSNVYRPVDTYDIMTYCPKQWTSTWSWLWLHTALLGGDKPQAASGRLGATGEGDVSTKAGALGSGWSLAPIAAESLGPASEALPPVTAPALGPGAGETTYFVVTGMTDASGALRIVTVKRLAVTGGDDGPGSGAIPPGAARHRRRGPGGGAIRSRGGGRGGGRGFLRAAPAGPARRRPTRPEAGRDHPRQPTD